MRSGRPRKTGILMTLIEREKKIKGKIIWEELKLHVTNKLSHTTII